MHSNHHSDNHPAPRVSPSNFIVRHFFLLVVVAAIAAVVYVETQAINVAGAALIALIIAHIVAVVVIMYGGRSILRNLLRRLHGQPVTSTMTQHSHDDAQGHSHHTDSLDTEGITLSWAAFYDLFTRILFGGQIKKMMQSTVKLANIQPGEKAMDVGCGTGTLAILAKQTAGQKATLYGVDASPQMIERAQEKARNAGVDVTFQTGLVESIQFPDGTFDVVMNSLMFHHLPSTELKRSALAEMYRTLKPGGRLLVIDFEPPKDGLSKAFLTMILGDMTSIDNTTVPPLLEQAGFVNVKIGPTDSKIATYIMGIKPSV